MNKNDTQISSRTDWERIDAMTDEDIDTSDIPPLSEDFFAKSKWRLPNKPNAVLLELDAETLAWYEAQGEAKTAFMLAALKIYAQVHQSLPKSA